MNIPLILLPGALGRLEGSEALAARLAEGRELLMVEHGREPLAALLDKVLAAADAAGAERFDLFGQSYGGWIAQCLTRRNPDRVRRLVLSHSFVAAQPWRFRLGARLLAAPPGLLAPLLRARLRRALAAVRRLTPKRHDAIIAGVDERLRSGGLLADLAAQQHCLVQSLTPPFADLPDPPPRPTLIIESDDDPLIGKRGRAALRTAFPHARVLRFPDAGHVSALTAAEAVAEAVQDFLG
jgi:pimeloyl-ACP methyl ester carboxylesterase